MNADNRRVDHLHGCIMRGGQRIHYPTPDARPSPAHETGIYIFTSILESKRVELLHEVVPNVKSVGMLANPKNTRAQLQLESAQEAARKLGLELHIRHAANPSEFEPAI